MVDETDRRFPLDRLPEAHGLAREALQIHRELKAARLARGETAPDAGEIRTQGRHLALCRLVCSILAAAEQRYVVARINGVPTLFERVDGINYDFRPCAVLGPIP